VQGDAGSPGNKVVDKNIIIGKRRAKDGERHKGSLPSPPPKKKTYMKESIHWKKVVII
jgi:hypothetical protein